MMFGVDGTLFLFRFSIVLIAIYLSHRYSLSPFYFPYISSFPLFLFSVHIYMVMLCEKTKKKKFEIAYARRNKKIKN